MILSAGGSVGKDSEQSSYQLIKNKHGGLCGECGGSLRWDQKHDERYCVDCGLIDPLCGKAFTTKYNPRLSNYEELPSYGHLGGEELDLMIGHKNHIRLQEIDNPENIKDLERKSKILDSNEYKEWRIKIDQINRPFKLSALNALSDPRGKDFFNILKDVSAERGYKSIIWNVYPDQIEADPLVPETRPVGSQPSSIIRFDLQGGPKKRLIGISSYIESSRQHPQDARPYKLWQEQKAVERAYYELWGKKENQELLRMPHNSPYQPWHWWLIALRPLIAKKTGLDSRAVDRALCRMAKKDIKRNARVRGDWARNTSNTDAWRAELESIEGARKDYGIDWLKHNRISWEGNFYGAIDPNWQGCADSSWPHWRRYIKDTYP